jgi:hypothetical protein
VRSRAGSGRKRTRRRRTPTVALSNTVSWRVDGLGCAWVAGVWPMATNESSRPSEVALSSWGSRIGLRVPTAVRRHCGSGGTVADHHDPRKHRRTVRDGGGASAQSPERLSRVADGHGYRS